MVSQQENYDEKGCNLYLIPIHINQTIRLTTLDSAFWHSISRDGSHLDHAKLSTWIIQSTSSQEIGSNQY